jgi:2,4-dienoyl-CoA reductase-like NADH-dependent reductase (Old Yellow Enzyme family)
MAEGGLPGERHLGYYEARAKGGAAMIVVEPMPVHATAVLTRGNFRHSDDAVIPAFRRITEACQAHGAVMIHQLYHVCCSNPSRAIVPSSTLSATVSRHGSR